MQNNEMTSDFVILV